MTWLKTQFNKLKKWLAGLGIISVALAAGIGDLSITTENEFLSNIATEQINELAVAGKYKMIPETKITISGKETEYKVYEYQTAKGEKGYQVFIRYYLPDKIVFKSVGYGVQAAERTFENIIITASTTPK